MTRKMQIKTMRKHLHIHLTAEILNTILSAHEDVLQKQLSFTASNLVELPGKLALAIKIEHVYPVTQQFYS